MTREVRLQQACLLDASGQNTLVHRGRSIIITVSVKCHSGKSLENGTPGELHPKILHIHPEAVGIRDQGPDLGEEKQKNLVKERIVLQTGTGTAVEMKCTIELDQNIRRLHMTGKMDIRYKIWTSPRTGVHPSLKIRMEPESLIPLHAIMQITMQFRLLLCWITQINRVGRYSRRRCHESLPFLRL